MLPKITKVRRRKSMIDLTEIGRVEQHLHALATKDQWLKEKFPEAHIVEPYEEPPQEIPDWYPDTKKVNFTDIIKNELFNLTKI